MDRVSVWFLDFHFQTFISMNRAELSWGFLRCLNSKSQIKRNGTSSTKYDTTLTSFHGDEQDEKPYEKFH